MTDNHCYVVILAGGGGTRLWPHSRRSRPKQFLPMLPDGETLIGATARRTTGVVPIERTLVVTTAEQVPELRRCLPELPVDNILVEPMGRNTAPCIGLAALVLWKRDPQAVMAVLPSDHYVANEAGFRQTLSAALSVAQQGHVVTLGIRPTHPETGYGYIELGPASSGVLVASAFVEKPNRQRAEEYLASGRYLWNAGTFFFPAQRILDELRQQLPELSTILDELGEHPERTAVRYPEAPAISIDYAVMERLGLATVGEARAIRVLPGDFGWNDVGSFAALEALHPADAGKNHVFASSAETPSPVILDSHDNLVWSDGKRLLALVGVSDLIVATTDDAVLVMPKSKAQQVKDVVSQLQKEGRTRFL